MAAGIYAARKQINTLILTGDIGGQANWSSGIENYLGYVFISGVELVSKFEAHLKQFGLELEYNMATKVSKSNGGFRIDTENGDVYYAQAAIIATGKSPKLLEAPGEKEFTGRGVTYCATCDAPLYAGMPVAVIGGGNSGLDAVMQLMKICPKVYLIEKEGKLCGDEILVRKISDAPNVELIHRSAVREIRGEQFVTSIVLEDMDTGNMREIPVQGVFVEIGLNPNSGLVKDLLKLNEYGEIPVDCAARTELEGLYAAGDVTAIPEKQIIVAAGDGAKAALGAYSYIVRIPRVTMTDWGPKSSE